MLVSTRGTASDWGPIVVAADGTIEFHRAGDPQQLCTLKPTQYGTYVGTCEGSVTRQLTLANPEGFEIPAGDDDLKILARARQILSGPSVWDRRREPACDEDRTKQSWSLFCALSQASLDVTGAARGLRPVWQEARAAAVEVAGHSFQGALKDFNSSESTTYSDLVKAFDITERRLRTMKACVASEPFDANVFAGSPSAGGADASPVYYWVERMRFTTNGQTFVFSNGLGPMDQRVQIPDDMLTSSVVWELPSGKERTSETARLLSVQRRTFPNDPRHPLDARGTLANGHRWRFAGLCGEVLGYRDSVSEVADYFDHLIDGVYFRQSKTAKEHQR